jgi:filamentous hemagglutinin
MSNNGGQIYTVSNSGAAINLHIGQLDNVNGIVYADGSLNVQADASIANDAGVLHAGTGATLSAAGALANGRGAIELASGALVINAASLENLGRIVNAGTAQTTISTTNSVVNSGTLAGNGALDLHTGSLQNNDGAQLTSGGAMLLGA